MRRKSFAITIIKYCTVILLAAAPLIAQPKKVRDEAKGLIEQGDRAFSQKNYKEASDKYGQAIVLIPNNPLAHYQKGFAHFNLHENDQAISEFNLAQSQGFKPPLAIYKVRAFIYFEQKNYDATLDDIHKGLELAPNDLALLKGLGEVHLARNAYPQALSALKKASMVAPNDADIQYNLARVYSAMGDVKGQQVAAETALARGTRFPGETHYLLAEAYQKSGNVAGAISSYQRAISSKPDLYKAYMNLSEIFRSEGRFNDSISTLKQGLLAFPNDGNLYTDLGKFYSLADRPADAVQAAKAGTQILPNQYQAYTYLCRAYIEVGRSTNDPKNYDLAIGACNTALRLKPDDGETYFYLGNALVSQEKGVEATRMYTRAVTGLTDLTAKNPSNSDGWYLLGNALFADKQFDKAIDAYLKCVNLSPKFMKARVNLGIAYTRKKNRPGAMEQYNILLPADSTLAARLKAEIDRM